MEKKNSNKESETTGFENIGKFYKHLRSQSKMLQLKAIDKEIYMLLVEYSFGYTKNIQTELRMSINQIMEECNISNKTAIKSIKSLIDNKLIERVKWQHVGPKQNYKYRVLFPNNYSIKYKNVETSEDKIKRMNQEFVDVL